jgi:hypothetical protein
MKGFALIRHQRTIENWARGSRGIEGFRKADQTVDSEE